MHVYENCNLPLQRCENQQPKKKKRDSILKDVHATSLTKQTKTWSAHHSNLVLCSMFSVFSCEMKNFDWTNYNRVLQGKKIKIYFCMTQKYALIRDVTEWWAQFGKKLMVYHLRKWWHIWGWGCVKSLGYCVFPPNCISSPVTTSAKWSENRCQGVSCNKS